MRQWVSKSGSPGFDSQFYLKKTVKTSLSFIFIVYKQQQQKPQQNRKYSFYRTTARNMYIKHLIMVGPRCLVTDDKT